MLATDPSGLRSLFPVIGEVAPGLLTALAASFGRTLRVVLEIATRGLATLVAGFRGCLLYTSDAADE